MAFTTGGKGVRSDINVTPLVDVVLVLLIIFMVLLPKLLYQTTVDVPPKSDAQPETQPTTTQLVVTISEDGKVAINDEAVSLEELPDKVRNLMAVRSKKLMFFNPADEANYGTVVKIMDICRGAGVKTLGIMTK
ncbi:MAG: biopolymer transporter ExbD [Myxococcales bacterium]|nr:biopolymer transporter ExbD [Myxococcota bacterium]MDW8283384.1 biopolymer transporter ExbD [Myxococcales bacterium]